MAWNQIFWSELFCCWSWSKGEERAMMMNGLYSWRCSCRLYWPWTWSCRIHETVRRGEITGEEWELVERVSRPWWGRRRRRRKKRVYKKRKHGAASNELMRKLNSNKGDEFVVSRWNIFVVWQLECNEALIRDRKADRVEICVFAFHVKLERTFLCLFMERDRQRCRPFSNESFLEIKE